MILISLVMNGSCLWHFCFSIPWLVSLFLLLMKVVLY